MPLPGEEIVTVRTAAEIKQLWADAEIAAFQAFCHCGACHEDLGRQPLTEQQTKIYNLNRVGWDPKQIAGRLKIPLPSVYDGIKKIRNNGWPVIKPVDSRHGKQTTGEPR
jgi:hypothetical protein